MLLAVPVFESIGFDESPEDAGDIEEPPEVLCPATHMCSILVLTLPAYLFLGRVWATVPVCF